MATLGSKILNKNYNKLKAEIADVVDDLFVMDEVDGFKEPKILHIEVTEVKRLLQKLKNQK